MELQASHSFHLYNQGNNQNPIFFEEENYLFFLQKMRTFLLPYTKIMGYCLMPNHFHWYIYIKDKMEKYETATDNQEEQLINNIATLLSSYTQAINKRHNRSGSLFRHKTKSVRIKSINQGRTCLHYVHQNPIKANLVQQMGEWPFSSFPDYAGSRNGSLISKDFTLEYLDLNPDSILENAKQTIHSEKIRKLY